MRSTTPWWFLALLLVLPVTAQVGAPYTRSEVLFHFQDDRIRESSGLVPAVNQEGILFTHNDSGHPPQLFAVDPQGHTAATYRVEGARNIDWEDIARYTDDEGRSLLYIGDIGDNNRVRKQIAVYTLPEPEVPEAEPCDVPEEIRTEAAQGYDLQYEDGARDAEGLLVDPRSGRLYVVSKSYGSSGIYAAPHPLNPNGINRLRKVATISWLSLPASPKGLREQVLCRLATGAAFSPTGDRVVIRTYTDAYEWQVVPDDLPRTFRARPLHIPLPRTKQGESITYSLDGEALLTSSEGKKAPVHRLHSAPANVGDGQL
jgi:hypothetical protein